MDVRDLIIDAGSWESWDAEVGLPDPGVVDAGYADDLRRARERAGIDESVITGLGRIDGVPVVLIVSEFAFLGGSIGAAAGARVVAALRRATAARHPVLALPASGGTRMQEGTAAFLQMAAITGAVVEHRSAGLPYLVYLRHPTTGGVFASWGSLGHLCWAEPGALVGFLGPRVYAGLYGDQFPDGVQTAENLTRVYVLDGVLDASDLRTRLGSVLGLLADAGPPVVGSVAPWALPAVGGPAASTAPEDRPPVWESVLATRAGSRAGVEEFLTAAGGVWISESGPIRLGLSRFGDRVAVVIGQDRRAQAAGELIGPAALVRARRAIAMARSLHLPIVTLVDTPGAELSVAAEEGGLAAEIACCMAELIDVPVPTVSVLLGQGGGGAALALFPADRRIAVSDAWLSPLPPEGASLIVHRTTDRAAEVAEQQGIAAVDLADAGIVDVVVAADDMVAGLPARVAEMLGEIARPDRAGRTRVPNGVHR